MLDINTCRWEISNVIRAIGFASNDYEVMVITVAYLLYYVDIEDKNLTIDEIMEKYKLDTGITYFIKENAANVFNRKNLDKFFDIKEKYDSEVFKELILDRNDEISESMGRFNEPHTPKSVEKLALKLLDIKKTSYVADLCCGVGTVALSMANSGLGAKVYGFEINSQRALVAKIKNLISSSKCDIEQKDVFYLPKDKYKFDRIFSDHPFSMKIQMMGEGKEYLDSLINKYPETVKLRSSDWLFNYLIMDLLKENGRAVTIMTNGASWNTEDTAFRKTFVEKGYIEAIISLPSALFYSTSIATTMIVLSKKTNSDGIFMVDASNSFEKGRRFNQLSEDNIQEILDVCNNKKSSIGRIVSVEEIKENEYALNPQRYLTEKIDIKNGIKFNEVIKNITRGSNIKAAELDGISSSEETDYQYLMLANIKDGIIDENLPYISELDESMEKYCVHKDNLVISKNGAPYKVAVVDLPDDKKVLANGNLFVIDLDLSKINPYYLKAFFESALGKAHLQSITVGSVMPCIGVKDLKNLVIPVPTLEEQKKIADEYLMLQDEIKILRLKTENAKEKIEHIFDESGVV